AQTLGTKQLDEDAFLDLIRNTPGKKSKHEQPDTPSKQPKKAKPSKQQSPTASSQDQAGNSQQTASQSSTSSPLTQTPTGSPVVKASFFNKDTDGASLKAALLSGPPGVGKTTTATLVCQELGYSYVEMNASDARSKKTLEQVVSESLSNKSMDAFVGSNCASKGVAAKSGLKHVLLMDEVDGMAGSEDRGGMQASILMGRKEADMITEIETMSKAICVSAILMVSPSQASGDLKKTLDLVSRTADSICDGDLVSRQIRSNSSWSLLPMQAMLSAVIPSYFISGGMGQRIDFPQWLGKNSKQGRLDRILQELQAHMRISTSADKSSINLEYIPHLRQALTTPLTDQTKSAFTRTYNKEQHKTPYAQKAAPTKSRGKGGGGGGESEFPDEDGADPGPDEDEDDLEVSAMMVKNKKATAATGKGKTSKDDTGKGKGKGKGRGKKS
ncbi:predicted protein, partial [Nematostella vectensis]